jgi:hypothetical protein
VTDDQDGQNNLNKEHRSTPEYAEYQADNFWASNDGKVPPFNTGTLLHISPTTTTISSPAT